MDGLQPAKLPINYYLDRRRNHRIASMGIFFTLLFIFTTYLAPSTVFGDLAQYHVEEIIAFIGVVFSCFHASGSGLMKMPQTYGVLGMFACVALSLAFNGVVSGVPSAWMSLLIGAIGFFFVLWNFRTQRQIKLLVATLLLIALIVVYQGASAVSRADTTSPWVLMMGFDGHFFSRIRGLGFINDPNDLCQFLVGLIPAVFIFWQRGKFLLNFLVVLLPVSVLVYGMFLTHSRGGMVGLLVAMIVLGRRKFGILPAVVTGGGLFVLLSAIGWSGGRDISAESGADRMEAWSVGLTLIRTHPLFGVGYLRFTEYFYITAHNTIVVCAAEIGVIGLFCWTLMVLPTLYDLIVAARPSPKNTAIDPSENPLSARRWVKAATLRPAPVAAPMLRLAFAAPQPSSRAIPAIDATPAKPSRGVFSLPESGAGTCDDDEIRRMCGLMMVSLSGFLASGWFLSRSYTMVLFVNIGLALAVHRLAVERGIVPARLTLPKAAKYSGIATIVVVAVVYAMLRITNLLPK